MSVQFGRWNFDGKSMEPDYLQKVTSCIGGFDLDGQCSYACDGVNILYLPFHTTQESRRAIQPHLTPTGEVITLDGRLDNREDLLREMCPILPADSTDVSIFAAVYAQYGLLAGLKRLIGDWAVAIWNPRELTLTLAKDFLGTRPLYYIQDAGKVTWSTLLDPLVLHADRRLALNEEYLAGWLASFPSALFTPFAQIRSVPPSSFVCIRPGNQTVQEYWNFDPGKRTTYRDERDYEEQFRSLFSQSVRRRLRSDAPVLAELSGGMDSSSIVCMADRILARGGRETPRLDTVSYYDNTEPNWDELPYIGKIEDLRRQTGFHIDANPKRTAIFPLATGRFLPTPGAIRSAELSMQLSKCLADGGSRVLLSGIGGDEVTGGVPDPLPELADLLRLGRLASFARQLHRWALCRPQPWLHLLGRTLRAFLPSQMPLSRTSRIAAPWLCEGFVHRNRTAFSGAQHHFRWNGALPSFQDHRRTLDALQKQFAAATPSADALCERRYPFLDRDFLEFQFAIPLEQQVRPGQRRSLLRRSLAGLVPDEILYRKRKAYISRAPFIAISTEWPAIVELSHDMVSSSLGLVDERKLRTALENARQGLAVPIPALLRTLFIESWLRNLSAETQHEYLKQERTVQHARIASRKSASSLS